MSGIIGYFVVGAFLVFAAEPNCPDLKGLDDQSVALFTMNRITELTDDYMAENIKNPQTYIGANQDDFKTFTQTYIGANQDDFNTFTQTYIGANQDDFNTFTQTYIGANQDDFNNFTETYVEANQDDFNTFTQTYIGANQDDFNTFTQTYIGANQDDFDTYAQNYMTAHQEDYNTFKSAQHDIFVEDFKANNEGAEPDQTAEDEFEASMPLAFIGQVVAGVYAGQVVARVYAGQVVVRVYAGQVVARVYAGQVVARVYAEQVVARVYAEEVVASAYIRKIVTDGITPTLTAEIKEYVQEKVEKCLITKGCGAFVVQGVSPNPPIPTFKGTSCTRCIDVISEEGCKNSTIHTCVWSGGTCSQTNCPTLMNDQFVEWRKSKLTKEQYLEKNHAKESQDFTRQLCKNYGCMYMNSFYWCSAWAKWALIVTLVVSILFVIAVVVGIVVFCVYKKKNKSLGQTESTTELERNPSEKKIEESNTQ